MKISTIRTRLIAVAVLLLSPAVGQAAPASPDRLRTELRQLEFAGIYWGEDMDATAAALTSRGFKVTNVFGEPPNFYEEVLNAVKTGERDRKVMRIEAEKGGERLELEFKSFPDGPRVTSATYDAGPHVNVLEFLRDKFKSSGVHVRGSETTGYFCLPSDALCDEGDKASIYGSEPSMPYLFASETRVQLFGGKLGKTTYEKLFEDKVKAYVGKPKPSL